MTSAPLFADAAASPYILVAFAGYMAGVLLFLFLIFNRVGQFKAGGVIMRQACGGVQDTGLYQSARHFTARTLTEAGVWSEESGARVEAEVAADHAKSDFYGAQYPDY